MQPISAETQSIRDIFSNHEFIIPNFQRPYSWEADQCVQLLDDISSSFDDWLTDPTKSPEYFLGSIVVFTDENSNKIWRIIDGQQRLTTLMMLVHALFNRARTYKALKGIMYKINKKTNALTNEVRLSSEVLPEKGRYNHNDFEKIMKLGDPDFSNMSAKNRFRVNYKCLQDNLENWYKGNGDDKMERFIDYLLDEVVLFPIKCKNQNDALKLFEIVNNRGMSLTAADIFKAQIYNAAAQEDKDKFIELWNGLEDHEDLFRIYMHISRANNRVVAKEIELKDYIINNHLKSTKKLTTTWPDIMKTLSLCNYVRWSDTTDDKEFNDKDSIYWSILRSYPNKYWQYPLFVFLHKHLEKQNDSEWWLPETKREEYLTLLENTVRYFYIKGVVHNSVNRVKNTTYEICTAISKEEGNYINIYKKCLKKKGDDTQEFATKLENSNFGRCLRGIVFLGSYLNPKQFLSDYAEIMIASLGKNKIHIEHILPKDYNHYDGFTKSKHGEYVEKLGNLIPLEQKINIKASNEFFARKQKKYQTSKVQDALDLVKKSPPKWYPEDIDERQQKIQDRLLKFFIEK